MEFCLAFWCITLNVVSHTSQETLYQIYTEYVKVTVLKKKKLYSLCRNAQNMIHGMCKSSQYEE